MLQHRAHKYENNSAHVDDHRHTLPYNAPSQADSICVCTERTWSIRRMNSLLQGNPIPITEGGFVRLQSIIIDIELRSAPKSSSPWVLEHHVATDSMKCANDRGGDSRSVFATKRVTGAEELSRGLHCMHGPVRLWEMQGC